MRKKNLAGEYRVTLSDDSIHKAYLPKTLDENHIGSIELYAEKWHPDVTLDIKSDQTVITNRFTRKYAWEGEATFQKSIPWKVMPHERVFLEIERARKLTLFFNDIQVTEYEKGTLSTPYLYELTPFLKEENKLEIKSSNTYEGWPKDAIRYSSAATNETQTNWNGILGKFRLKVEKERLIKTALIYSMGETFTVRLEIDAISSGNCCIRLHSEAFVKDEKRQVKLQPGINTLVLSGIQRKQTAKLWDEYDGRLYLLWISGNGLKQKKVSFGIREFGDDGAGHLSLNGHRIFLRGEANCCVYANTGHMPMTVPKWRQIMSLYREYGINCVRFHSHCPPDAAFVAADELGMMVQPELSNWDSKTALESEESFRYYQSELRAILRYYGNHPSFVMLTFGNELNCTRNGEKNLHSLLEYAKQLDSTRLYAIASNAFYGMKGCDALSDFYTSSNYYDQMLRGTSAGMLGYINEMYPNSKTNYNHVLQRIREKYTKPVFSFEVGQYEIYPDFRELDSFTGVMIPNNYKKIKADVTNAGMLKDWEHRVEVTGKMSRLAYREEIEAALRTPDLSGISLLGLQDFPGQGTALVGMLNSHMKSKPYEFANPEQFHSFFSYCQPLALMDKYTYTTDEKLMGKIIFANYGKEDIIECCHCRLYCKEELIASWSSNPVTCKKGQLTDIGTFNLMLEHITESSELRLKLSVGAYQSEYPVWVYVPHAMEVPKQIKITRTLTKTLEYLKQGKTVFFSPMAEKEQFVQCIRTQFTTDFWSVGTFPWQEGYMGCLPNPKHAIYRYFPTKDYPSWQWWPLTNSYAMILPKEIQPLLEAMDSYAYLRKLGFMFEAKVGQGKLLASSMGLLEKQQYPEVRAMLYSIYSYMSSGDFQPKQELTKQNLEEVFP